MNTRMVTILIVTTLVGLGGLFFLLTMSSNETPNDAQNNDLQDTSTNSPRVSENTDSFTLTEVEKHDSKNDCWTIINNSVYDITSYVPRHPGGDEILEACGEDATTMFTTRTDKDGQEIGSGTPHSSSAEQQLKQLKIGALNR